MKTMAANKLHDGAQLSGPRSIRKPWESSDWAAAKLSGRR